MEPIISLLFGSTVKLDEENLNIFTKENHKIIKVEKKPYVLSYNLFILVI